jgi:hypothetical protein
MQKYWCGFVENKHEERFLVEDSLDCRCIPLNVNIYKYTLLN